MMELIGIAGIVALVVAVWGVQFVWPRARIVRAHERALRFRKGRLLAELGPGRYWLRPRIEELTVVDTRRRQVILPGQEVLTSDRVPLKVSLIAEYTVVDVTKAITVVEDFQKALYGRVQLALREAVAAKDLDAALGERGELGSTIRSLVADAALEHGLELHQVSVRDFMMAAGLRDAYANVLLARQQGLAALERARGESAAVRNLANTAELMEKHPGLMQLRLLQAVESGSGNRVVIALDPQRANSLAAEAASDGGA